MRSRYDQQYGRDPYDDFEDSGRRRSGPKRHRHMLAKAVLVVFFLALAAGSAVLACSPSLRGRCLAAVERYLPVDRPAQAAQAVGVTTANLHLREGAGLSYSVICTIPKGSSVQLMSGNGSGAEWVQVKTEEGQTGWCSSRYLQKEPERASSAGSAVSAGNALSPSESAAPAQAEVQVSLSQAVKPLSIYVSLSDQNVKVLDKKGRVVKSFVCSSGKKGDETPTGTFTIQKRGEKFYSKRLGEGAYYWTQFQGNFLFHSVPFDGNRRMEPEEAAKLGTPASHGCIRLATEDAKWIYDNIPKGTEVVIQ